MLRQGNIPDRLAVPRIAPIYRYFRKARYFVISVNRSTDNKRIAGFNHRISVWHNPLFPALDHNDQRICHQIELSNGFPFPGMSLRHLCFNQLYIDLLLIVVEGLENIGFGINHRKLFLQQKAAAFPEKQRTAAPRKTQYEKRLFWYRPR